MLQNRNWFLLLSRRLLRLLRLRLLLLRLRRLDADQWCMSAAAKFQDPGNSMCPRTPSYLFVKVVNLQDPVNYPDLGSCKIS